MFASVIHISKTFYGRCFHSLANSSIMRIIRTKQNTSEIHFTRLNYFSSKSMKVAVLGAGSKTGNCLSLLLKQSPLIDELAIYDNKSIRTLALDLNYIDTKCRVSASTSFNNALRETLEGAKVVMIVGDESLSKGILKHNANFLSDLLPNVIKFCPQAMVAIAVNPINSLIPLTLEMYKKAGVYNPNCIFGVISVNCVRANNFAAEVLGIEPECVMVPMIGGGCSCTCVPLFSHTKPCDKISEQEARLLIETVRTSDEKILKLSKGKGRSSFAMAFGAARFCVSLCKALRHQSGVLEYAYVRSCLIPELTYFTAPLELGPDGIQRHLGVPPLNDFECNLLKAAIPRIKKAIKQGEALALGEANISSEMCLEGDDFY